MSRIQVRTVTRLRAEHGQLREALGALAISMAAAPIPDVEELRLMCRTLAGQLRRHIRREELLATLCARVLGRLGSLELNQLALEHHEEMEQLWVLTRCMSTKGPVSLAALRPSLAALVDRLTGHMRAQEAQLFPLMEGLLIPHEVRRGTPRLVLRLLIEPPAGTPAPRGTAARWA